VAVTISTAIDRALEAWRDERPLTVLGGGSGFSGLLLARALEGGGPPLVVVAADEARARALAADVCFFAGINAPSLRSHGTLVDGPVVLLRDVDVTPYADVSADPRRVGERLGVLARLGDSTVRMIFMSARTLARRVIPAPALDAACRLWGPGTEIGREDAMAVLDAAGYRRTELVRDPGAYAVRGGVIDVFVPLARYPARIELFGDEVERVRLFDPESQRSLREVDELLIHPVRETIPTTEVDLRAAVLAIGDRVEVPSSETRRVIENLDQGLDFFGIEALTPIFHAEMVPVWQHLPDDARWFIPDLPAIRALAVRQAEEIDEQYGRALASRALVDAPDRFFVAPQMLSRRLDRAQVIAERLDLHGDGSGDDGRALVRVDAHPNLELRARMDRARAERGAEVLRPLVDRLRALEAEADAGGAWTIVLVAPTQTHAERLTAMLRGHGLEPRMLEAEQAATRIGRPAGSTTTLLVVPGGLSEGFAAPGDRLLILSEAEIFGRVTRKHRGGRRRTSARASLSRLAAGDYIVHFQHGVGRYQGMSKLVVQGIPQDFAVVEYAGNDKLYLPVHRVADIERFVSAEAKAPRLDKLGGTTFEAKAKKVRADVRQLAEELLQIYAQREAERGHAHAAADDAYAQFEATFPFEETPDQLDAIEASQADLGSDRPMDRLVCGDVGFGKTEVALRAAFRVAMGGKQVAVLAPTTILVQQHFLTFSDRLHAFGIEVGVLNRFVGAKQRRETIERLKSGALDVVVGTHRLLSRDVHFADLGLVVIDEEHRFGVKQKERFKKLKTQVDVLTLTATPIPRTLHFSLLGLREISMITTPPADRLAVRTALTRSSERVIEEAIRAELARGGQAFYVVPRVLGIDEHARRIRQLVPDARVVVAHGKMPGELLERTMLEFLEHRADVLVSTTIIESGLDIPRANTMLIDRADHFGMAQLHQLRGRIGRSQRRAHCFLMVESLERLAPEARRRLEAVVRNSELGTGFNVASEDLEIRGAGDILGKRQSGHIAAVGFEAYARILGEAVAELRGDPILNERDPELAFDLPAFIPDDYVDDTGQRLDFYRRLSAARDADDVRDVLEEMNDRYGELPLAARHFGAMMICKTYGRRLGASSLELRGTRFSLRLSDDTPLMGESTIRRVREGDGTIRFGGRDRLIWDVPERTGEDCTTQLAVCEGRLAEIATWVA
jgi:transcription-repair coupling factor (superfamily II helicase)